MAQIDEAQKAEGFSRIVPSAKAMRVEAGEQQETALWPEHMGQEMDEDINDREDIN